MKPQFNNQLLRTPGPLLGEDGSTISNQGEETQGYYDKLLQACQPIENFLEFKMSGNDVDSEAGLFRPCISGITEENDENVSSGSSSNLFCVPSSLIERWGSAMGIFLLYRHSPLSLFVIPFCSDLTIQI